MRLCGACLPHEAFRDHVTPPGHPERVERLGAVERGLAGLAVERRDCPVGEEAEAFRLPPGAVPGAGEGGDAEGRLGATGRRYLPVAGVV